MNILDLQYEFSIGLENLGDNEIDLNLVTIQRMAIDANGDEIPTQETYRMKQYALEEWLRGCEAMAFKIKQYLLSE